MNSGSKSVADIPFVTPAKAGVQGSIALWPWIPAFAGMTMIEFRCASELREEVVALVVDDDESREIDHLDTPDRFHAELGVFDEVDFLDAILRQPRRRPADRAEIEAFMLLAGIAHFGAAIAL